MFNGLINLHDFVVLAERLYVLGPKKILAKLGRSRQVRVAATWEQAENPWSNWWDIPAVERRWNRLITGSEGTTPTDYVAARYLNSLGLLRAVSLGCGTGGRELAWARACPAMTIDGYDVSAPRIEIANTRARDEGLADHVRFHVADVHALEFDAGSLDVVITEGALHHFEPMTSVVQAIHRWLRPGGLFILNEFVGPGRFQWSDRQLELVRELLARMPERFRIRKTTGRIKQGAYRPGRLSMYLNDPSEAADSGAILPTVCAAFETVELKEFGGTLLQLLFKDIAHNFLGDDPETKALLAMAFDEEERALAAGEITSDFVYGVFRRAGG